MAERDWDYLILSLDDDWVVDESRSFNFRAKQGIH
jgi:hypothetical protein